MRGFRRQFAIGSATKDRLNIVKIPYNNILAWRSGTYNRNDPMAAYIAKSTSVCLNSEFEYINIDPLKKYEMIISTNKYNNLYNMQIFINQLNDKGECIDTLSFYNTNDKIPLTLSKDCVKIKISISPQSGGSYDGLKIFWKTFYMEVKTI